MITAIITGIGIGVSLLVPPPSDEDKELPNAS
jgi:hypothetical protein